jgi:hypothetical protein
LPEFNRRGVLDMDRTDDSVDVRFHLVHELHRLENAECLARANRLSFLDERRRARLRRAVERPDHRRLDAHDAVRSDRIELAILQRRERSLILPCRRLALLGSTDGDAHPCFLDRDFADARLLDDADELANPFGAGLVDPAGGERPSPDERPRIVRSNGSALSPKSPSSNSSSSLEARPSACARTSCSGGAVPSSSESGSAVSETMRRIDFSIGAGVVPRCPSTSERSSSTTTV